MKSLLRLFLSRSATVLLIALLAVIYFLGAVIPQKKIMQSGEFAAWEKQWPAVVKILDALHFTNIYSSPLALVVTVLFFVHLIVITCKRIPAALAAMRSQGDGVVTPASLQGLHSRTVTLEDPQGTERIIAAAARGGYRIAMAQGSFRGIKNGFSVFGSLIFHLSFIVILLGALTIFHSRFAGVINVTEGQEFRGTPREYQRVHRFSGWRSTFPDIAFRLLKVNPTLARSQALSLRTEIEPLEKARQGETVSLDVNHPWVDRSVTMLIKEFGVAPYFEVRDKGGKELLGAFFTLNILKGDPDSFAIPGSPYEIVVRFWPDFAVDDQGYIFTRSYALNRPLFKVEVLKDGRPVGNGKLHSPADAVDFEGLRLSYKEIRYYGTFTVTDEYGGGILITGFAIALVGLVLKFLFERRTVLGIVREEGGQPCLTIACRSEYYRDVAQRELDGILERSGVATGDERNKA